MATFLALEASTERPRAEAMSCVLAVLGADGGFVTGTEQLGGLALMLRLELPADAAKTLARRLAEAGIRLDPASRAALAALAEQQEDLVGSLLLRFFASEPDLKLEIPKVPG